MVYFEGMYINIKILWQLIEVFGTSLCPLARSVKVNYKLPYIETQELVEFWWISKEWRNKTNKNQIVIIMSPALFDNWKVVTCSRQYNGTYVHWNITVLFKANIYHLIDIIWKPNKILRKIGNYNVVKIRLVSLHERYVRDTGLNLIRLKKIVLANCVKRNILALFVINNWEISCIKFMLLLS